MLGSLVILALNISSPFMALYARELGATEILIGVVMSAFFFSRIFIEIPAGYISDRIGYRIPLTAGFVLSSLASGIAALASAPFHLLVARILGGVGSALFFNASINFVILLAEKGEQEKAMARYRGIGFIGSLLGAPIGGWLGSIFGLRVTFIVSTCIHLTTLIVISSSRELKNATSQEAIREEIEEAPDRSWRGTFRALQEYVLLVVCLTGFLRMFSVSGIFSTVAPIYLRLVLGFELSTIGLLMGARSIGMVISTFLAGRTVNKIGKPWIYVVSRLLLGTTILTLILFPSIPAQTVAFLLSGVASGILMPLLPVTAAEVVEPSVRGIAISLYRTAFDLGAIVAPVFLTWVMTLWGIEICFYIVVGLMLFNAGLSTTLMGRIE
jgi:MFS family permease